MLFFVGANDSPSKLVSLAMKLPIYCFMTVILLSLMLIWYYKYWVHFPGGEARDVYDPISWRYMYTYLYFSEINMKLKGIPLLWIASKNKKKIADLLIHSYVI